MEWYEDYYRFLNAFKKSVSTAIDETAFYFKSDKNQYEHYIGYDKNCIKPYWVGYCDIDDGCEFNTADELFNAKIFDGKSIKDRWDDIQLIQIGGIAVDEWQFIYGLVVE